MAYEAQKNGYSNDASGIASSDVRKELEAASRKAFQEFESVNRSGKGDQKTKLFGVFEMDASIAGLISGFYNEASRRIGKIVAPRTYDLVKGLAENHTNLNHGAIAKTATVAAVAVNTALSSAVYLNPIFQSMKEQHVAYRDITRKVAPVLDDLKGKHTLGAFTSVKAADNEVIYAHRKRMARRDHVTNMNNLIHLAINGGPAILETEGLKDMWKGNGSTKDTDKKKTELQELMEWVMTTFAMGRGPLATYLTESNAKDLKKHEQAYSTLQMILTLEEQVANNPKARSFQTPGKSSRESYGLEEYVIRTLIHHQKEMADLDPEHTELREALSDELAAVAKPLAEAIRSGQMSALTLVRLVGEGKIIKNRGRAIASAEDVEALVEEFGGKSINKPHVDPKDFYANSSFTRNDLKEVLKNLEGEEKNTFAAWVPDAVLEEAGMKADEIKALREENATHYNTSLSNALAGLATKDDAALKAEGMAQAEIKQLRKAMDQVSKLGDAAVDALKSSPTHVNGIEQLMLNVAVPQIQGDRSYLGTLMNTGREAMSQIVETAANDELVNRPAKANFADKYASTRREISPEELDAANDEMGFAESESYRDGTHFHR